ncbi:MAG: acyl-CoA/acyl-ACP dehydrogenase [Rhizobiaceae bacterium]|nr:acyl-CoA/acyl-ACP dehydrogenase [Rhizobiaceae bacterium]
MVDLIETPEQAQLVDATLAFLGREMPLDRLREPAAGDVGRWRDMADLGWFGLGVTEEAGGVGLSVAEQMLLFRQLGRFVVTPAVLAGVLGARIAVDAGKGDLAASIIAGETRVALASPLGIVEIGDRVEGNFHLFEDDGASHVVAWNRDCAVILGPDAIGSRRALKPLDDRLSLAETTLSGAALAVSRTGVHRQADILIAAMQTGIAEAARDLAVEYAGMREQFGQKIGAFQAIKHRCANMALRAEAALSQTVFAALSEASAKDDAALHGAAARLVAADAALANSAEAIQVHGGIGFTAECHAQRFLKRAHVLSHLGGTARQRRDALLEETGGD